MASDTEKDSLLRADDENHFSIPTSMTDPNRAPTPIDEQEDFVFYLRGGRMLRFSRMKFNVFLSVVTVITNVMMVVSLPLFSGKNFSLLLSSFPSLSLLLCFEFFESK